MNEVLCSNGPNMLGNDYCNIRSNMLDPFEQNLNVQISADERKSCYGHKMSEYRVQTEPTCWMMLDPTCWIRLTGP